MQEQQRNHEARGGNARPGFWESLADSEVAATVLHGPYAEMLPVAGLDARTIRERYRDRFDIDPNSEVFVDGERSPEDTVIQAGQVVMFVRRAGEKGVGS